MVKAVILAAKFWAVVYECQRVCRNVELWDDLNADLFGMLLQLDEFCLGVVTVA